MLLTITLERSPATDLGYLLHKHPGRRAPQTFSLGFGQAHVFWPEASDDRATAALVVEVDPVGLVRRKGGGGDGFALYQYVNDRPYVASSFMSVAIGEVYGTALSGRCRERPALVDEYLPLCATIAVVPAREGDRALRDLFEPLGYMVEIDRPALDPRFLEWGDAPHVTLGLRGAVRLRDLLAHLTVLIPVLDDAKHYFVGEDEIDKLLRRGEGWLHSHPHRESIARRYLRHRRTLVADAITRLAELDDLPARSEAEAAPGARLHDQRLAAAVDALRESGARRVLDLGCGEGRLLRLLRDVPQFTEIVGLDVAHHALERAARALELNTSGTSGTSGTSEAAPHARVKLLHGALTYRDPRLAGYDAAAAIELIEHLDPWRIAAFSRVVFGEARPGTVVVTTPNADYNVRFPGLDAGAFRHADHRFEWTRAEFRDWCESVCATWGYRVRIDPIGPLDPEAGAPSQMAVFSRDGWGRTGP